MDVNFVYEIMLEAVGKNKNQGYLSPAEFERVINQAQYSYMDYLMGQYQKYMPMRPVSVVQFGNNERVRQSIAPLIYGTILSVDGQGVAPFPVYYEYTDQIWSVYGVYNIRFSQQNQLDSYVHSVIDPVVNNPVYVLNTEGYKFYPNDIGQVNLSYVKRPPSIIWGYTPDGNDIPVYNPLTSNQPIWGDADMLNIIVRALALVGVNLQSNVVIGYANNIKNGGQ